MKIRILCVGKVKEEFYRNRIREYSAVIRKRCSFEIIEAADERTAEHMSAAEVRRVQKAEGERLLKYLKQDRGELVTALCIDGDMHSTGEWIHDLEVQRKQKDIREFTFIIGGSLGLAEEVIRRSDRQLSFSRLTFPHQLMRVMLAEQLAALVESGYLW